MFSLARLLKGPHCRLYGCSPRSRSLWSQDPEVDARLIEDLGRGLGYLLQSRVVAGIAAGEVEDLLASSKSLTPKSSAQFAGLSVPVPRGYPTLARLVMVLLGLGRLAGTTP